MLFFSNGTLPTDPGGFRVHIVNQSQSKVDMEEEHVEEEGNNPDHHHQGAGQHQDEMDVGSNNDEAAAGPEAAHQPAAGPAGDSGKSFTKSELFAAYKGVGPHKTCMDIMSDVQLRGAAEILVHVTHPLHMRYKHDLDCQTSGVETMLEWAAQRSLAESQKTVLDVFRSHASVDLFKALRLGTCNPPLEYNTNWNSLQNDIDLAEKAFTFSVHLSANYAWSEMLHQYTMPLAATSLLAMDRRDQKRAMKHLKTLVNAIVAAEDAAPTNPAVRNCLLDVAFPDEPMAREIMILLKRGNFDLASDSTIEVQEAMRKFNSGSSSTKEILESTFAHLSYVVNASNKNKVTAPSMLWFYCTSSPYVQASGMHQHIPTAEEWVKWVSDYGRSKTEMMQRFAKSFQASGTPFPSAPDVQLPKTIEGIAKSKWRLAGPGSHYKSSSAVAYLMSDVDFDFKNCQDAWAG